MMMQTVKDSPVYQALESATDAFLGQLGYYDLKTRTSFDHAPIAAVRAFAEARGVLPHATMFDERFERDVCAAWKRWYTERDSETIINLLATLLMVRYIPQFSADRRTLEICFTPTPYRLQNDVAYQQYLTAVVEWLLPFYSEIGQLNIVFCYFFTGGLYVNAALLRTQNRFYLRAE